MVIDRKFRVSAWILAVFMLINGNLGGTSSADVAETDNDPVPLETTDANETGLFETITTTVQIDPGEMFYIYFDPEDRELEARPAYNLPEECDEAIALAPKWLRGNLSYKFRQLDSDFRTTYANLILNSPDPKYIDEIAFVIAHTAVQNLEDNDFFPELITHNAELVYENDQFLHYVEVVEREDYTTVVYKDKDNLSVELPRQLYYWYIVHPKLSDELATYIDPEHNYTKDSPIGDRNHGVPPPTGKFWRDWLFYFNDSGYPLLKDKLGGAYTLWEAISACNSWVGGSMRFTSDTERPIQPVRIYRKHYGRCGEYQDMRNAAARSGLIPSASASNRAEDHVWNEFWDGRWIHWDGTVDNPMMYENGWGKTISSVWNTRGDSYIWSVTEKYTLICNYTATVLDDSGLPVDGALVRVLTEDYYFPDRLTTTTCGVTDYRGSVIIPLGDERNFWSSAESDDLGSDPMNGETQVISNSEAGVNYTHTFNLPMSAPSLNAENTAPPMVVDPDFWMEVEYEVEANIVRTDNVYTGERGDLYGPSGNIHFFISDSINYNLFNNDLSFDAYYVQERSTSGNATFALPDEDTYYAVLDNGFSQETMKIVKITVKIFSPIQIEITGPQDNQEFDDGEIVFITGTSRGPRGISTVEIEVDELGVWQPAADTSGMGEEPYSYWQYNLDTDELKPGIHKITARASFGYNSSSVSLNISLIDVTSPDILVDNPSEEGKYWLGETIIINGTITDNGWINSLKLIIDSDEQNSTNILPFLNDDFFSYNLYANDLGYGEHTITIWVNDTESNFASITRNILILESVEPEVRIDTPSENSVFKRGDIVEITGFAQDNQEIVFLEIIIGDGSPKDIFTSLDENGFWSYSWKTNSVSIGEDCSIKVQGSDFSGNSHSDTIDVILDCKAPKVSITAPERDQVFKAGHSIEITGTASDDCSLESVQLVIDEETPVDITWKVANENWDYDLRDTYGLDSGEHTIIVSATDSVGRNSKASLTFIIDSQIPEIEIEEVEDSIIIGESLTLRGYIGDDIEVTKVELIIDYNDPIDITSHVAYGCLEYDLETSDISQGKHKIFIKVTDCVGNEVTDEIRISFITEASEIDELDDGSIFDSDKDSSDKPIINAYVFLFIIIIILCIVIVAVFLILSRKGK